MKEPDVEKAMEFLNLYNSQYSIKDLTIYTCLMEVFLFSGNDDKVLEIYIDVQKCEDFELDSHLFSTMIKGYYGKGDLERASYFYEEMKKFNIKCNRIVYNNLMDLSVKQKQMKKALYFIEEMN